MAKFHHSLGYVFGLEACSHPIWTVVEPVPRIGGMLFVWNSWARSQAKRKSFERDREITTNFGGQPSPLPLQLWNPDCTLKSGADSLFTAAFANHFGSEEDQIIEPAFSAAFWLPWSCLHR